MMIGPVIKHYGSFRLHRYAISLKGGELLNMSRYYVIVGELPVPLILPLRAGRTQRYGHLVRNREGPFHNCVYVGEIPITRSTHRGLYDHIDRWLKNEQTGIECYAEQLTASNIATSNRRRENFYRRRITRAETDYKIVSDAFHTFLLEYPNAAVGSKRDAAMADREARRDRKRYQRSFRLINRVLQ